MVLDYLPVPDLMCFARTSKRMQEMVYDDTRWVSKLQQMGLWNETEARQKAEAAMKRKMEGHVRKGTDGGSFRNGPTHPSANGVAVDPSRRRSSTTATEHLIESKVEALVTSQPAVGASVKSSASAELNGMPLSATSTNALPIHLAQKLHALDKVRSIRGAARQEFGKLYWALAPYYADLTHTTQHVRVFQDYQDPEQQARMLAQIAVFAQCDTYSGWQIRETSMETMIGHFENAALREFEKANAMSDYDGRMRKYAHVLVELNGGASVIDSFISNNRLTQPNSNLGNPLDCLHHSFPGQANLNPSRDFFQKLSIIVQEQASIIDRVFPPTVDAGDPFLDRVGTDVVTPYVTPLFEEAHSSGYRECYLKIVSGVFEHCTQFISALESTDTSQKPPIFQHKHKVLQSVFEPHIELFLTEEQDFYKEQAGEVVERWDAQLKEQEASAESFFMSNINRQAAKRDFLTSFKKVLMAPVNVLPSISGSKPTNSGETSVKQNTRPSTPPQAGPDDTNSLNVNAGRSASPFPPVRSAPTTELEAKAALMNSRLAGINALFSIEVALTMVHITRSSIERSSQFTVLDTSQGLHARRQCEAIFLSLLEILGWRHIKPGFDKAVDHLTSYSARQATVHNRDEGVKPLVTFLELVNVGDLIQQMVDVFYVQELCAHKLTDRDDFLNPATKDKKKFEQMLDERVAAGLNKGIDVLIDEVEFIFGSTQASTDYNPSGAVFSAKSSRADLAARPSATEINIGPTETAQRIVELVGGHTSMLVGTTDKTLLDIFNREVGVRLFTSLCKHLKRQRVSQDGAVRLIADMSIYHSYISTLKNKELLRYFRALRELSQLFLVDGKQGKEIAVIIADNDRYQGIFRAEEAYEFAERRADWYTVRANVEKHMYGMACTVM